MASTVPLITSPFPFLVFPAAVWAQLLWAFYSQEVVTGKLPARENLGVILLGSSESKRCKKREVYHIFDVYQSHLVAQKWCLSNIWCINNRWIYEKKGPEWWVSHVFLRLEHAQKAWPRSVTYFYEAPAKNMLCEWWLHISRAMWLGYTSQVPRASWTWIQWCRWCTAS